jgi:REP element-mobilizing transposase RayT
MKRKSIRLSDYDYSQGGCYFITICAKDKKCYLGEISLGEIKLSEIGKIAYGNWENISAHYLNADLDEFIVMPNHIHGLIWLMDDNNPVGAQNFEPLQKNADKKHRFQKIIPKSIGSIIRAYKASVTRWCNNNSFAYFQWQRNYYERVIRNERELKSVREYIINNPQKWAEDDYYVN